MKNIIPIQCDLFPKNKIIEILKYNNFYFNPNQEEGFGGYISFSEDRVWFMKKVIILNHVDFKIAIGNTYREDTTNDSAFQIYSPCQIINEGFNYNSEFSKRLIAMDDFDLKSSSPILSINLNKKNLDKLIDENDITFSNVQTRVSKKFKPVNFEQEKRKGIEKLFLYKHQDFFIVIGWLLQGRQKRNTVIYNKSYTEFLTGIESIDLKTPEGFDKKRNNKENNKKDGLEKENNHTQSGDHGLKYNRNTEDHNFVNRFKSNSKSKPKDTSDLWADNTLNIDKINIILEKITKSGIDSLSIQEMIFLKNNSGNV
jgi:hypothetical protein